MTQHDKDAQSFHLMFKDWRQNLLEYTIWLIAIFGIPAVIIASIFRINNLLEVVAGLVILISLGLAKAIPTKYRAALLCGSIFYFGSTITFSEGLQSGAPLMMGLSVLASILLILGVGY